MKNVIGILFVLVSILGFSQDVKLTNQIPDSINKTTNLIEDFPDTEPYFGAGNDSLSKFISTNVIYPEDAIKEKIEGNVYITFIIEIDGAISNLVLKKGVSKSIDEEAMRFISSMPNWVPATKNGEKVRSRAMVPIKFTLGKDKKRK